MKRTEQQISMKSILFIALAICITLAWATTPGAAEQKFKVEGVFIEGCGCAGSCQAEVTGQQSDCETMGVMSFTGGKFMDVDLKDSRIAYAGKRGDWVRIYVDAVNPVQREAAIAFAKNYLSTYAHVETTMVSKIALDGKDGQYTAKVNEGSIMTLTTQPVLGGDNKNPIKFQNVKSRINPEIDLGRTVFGSFSDGPRKIEVKNGDALFNPDMNTGGAFD